VAFELKTGSENSCDPGRTVVNWVSKCRKTALTALDVHGARERGGGLPLHQKLSRRREVGSSNSTYAGAPVERRLKRKGT